MQQSPSSKQPHSTPLCTVYLLVMMFFGLLLASCSSTLTSRVGSEPAAAPPSRTATGMPTATQTAVLTNTPPPTGTNMATPTATATGTSIPSNTPTVTQTPSPTLFPTATPIPTPGNLPLAPRGWHWVHVADAIQVTHYITAEIEPESVDGLLEQPYAPDNQPLAGVGPLPRRFLEQVAYQGSGRLPNGNLLEYAATNPPAIVDGVPYRYVITSAAECNGYPKAANLSCSAPYETAATTYVEGEPLIPVGSTIFIVELNLKVYVNDTAGETERHKIDLYTGYVNNYDSDRPNGSAIWLLVLEGES